MLLFKLFRNLYLIFMCTLSMEILSAKAFAASPEILCQDLNNISSWPKDQIEDLLENREEVKELLLKKILSSTRETIKLLFKEIGNDSVSRARAFIAVFVANHIVNFESGEQAAWLAGNHAAKQSSWDVLWYNGGLGNNTWEAARSTTWYTVRDDAWDEAWSPAWKASEENAYQEAYVMVFKTLKIILPKLGSVNPNPKEQIAYNLSEIMTLNWLWQKNSQYFSLAFKAAFINVPTSVRIESAWEIIRKGIYVEKLEKNPFVTNLTKPLLENLVN